MVGSDARPCAFRLLLTIHFRSCTEMGPEEIRKPSVGKLYARLLDSEMSGAREYFVERLRARSLDDTAILENLKKIPAAVSQHLRLNYMLWVCNGLATTHRVATFNWGSRRTNLFFVQGRC